MKKLLLFLAILLTFGMVLIPKGKAASIEEGFSSNQLNSINQLSNVTNSYSTGRRFQLYPFSTTGESTSQYLAIQMFNIDSLDSPSSLINNYRTSTTYSFIMLTDNTKLALSLNSSSRYLYYNGVVNPSNIQYIQIAFSTSDNSNFNNGLENNWIFNLTFSPISYSVVNSFVPNTYYNIDSINYNGYVNSFNVYLGINQQGNMIWSNVNRGAMSYNTIRFSSTLVDSVYSVNSNSSTSPYVMKVDINQPIFKMPNFSISYLEIQDITINGVKYTYDSARNQFSWLGQNIVLYNDNATLFTDLPSIRNVTSVLNSITFRLPDYTFTTSSYYQSSIGLRGYLTGMNITLKEYNSTYLYNNGYDTGYLDGYNNGKSDGYTEGVNSHTTGFDNLMLAIGNVPVSIIHNMLDFEILGFNLKGVFMGIITLLLFVFLFRKFKE